MNRRLFAVAVVVALMTASAHAVDGARKQDAALAPAPAERPLSLHALFDRAPCVTTQDTTQDANGITTGPSGVNVIVARIDTDGKLVKACVDNEADARRFLEAPIEKVQNGRAKEQ
jgi:hypothetical protein